MLAPWPNRIRDGRYSFAGRDYQLPLTEPTRHNAIHGLVNRLRWSVVDPSGASVQVTRPPPPTPGYPWPLELRTTWSVGADGLTAEHQATNTGGGTVSGLFVVKSNSGGVVDVSNITTFGSADTD